MVFTVTLEVAVSTVDIGAMFECPEKRLLFLGSLRTCCSGCEICPDFMSCVDAVVALRGSKSAFLSGLCACAPAT